MSDRNKDNHQVQSIIAGLQEAEKLAKQALTLSNAGPEKLRQLWVRIDAFRSQLLEIQAVIQPDRHPKLVLNPADPQTIAKLIAAHLIRQQRLPLSKPPTTFGSGVYAIYYEGDLELYKTISSTDNPIYVGSSVSADADAVRPFDQGQKLANRLKEHRKTINAVKGVDSGSDLLRLSIADFTYRYLVTISAWELVAEAYLIRFFKPVWNKEVKVMSGFGKHGDASGTRGNTKSEWDTLHFGRPWADTSDRKTVETISSDVLQHLASNPPRSDTDLLNDAV